jgi:hypothetical protein
MIPQADVNHRPNGKFLDGRGKSFLETPAVPSPIAALPIIKEALEQLLDQEHMAGG